MERKLLLLGLLRAKEMHGYQINEFIENHLGTSIQIKKPTVYKLLGKMVDDGLIQFYEEQEGSYPTRRVYTITAEGEQMFQRLLRQQLAEFKPVSYMGSVGFAYLDALPGTETVVLLQQRRAEIEQCAQVLRTDENHPFGFQLMFSYHLSQLQAELEWLDQLIEHLPQT